MVGNLAGRAPHAEGSPESDAEEGKERPSQTAEINGANGTDLRQLPEGSHGLCAVSGDVRK